MTEPTESTERYIKVRYFWRRQEETVKLESITEAIAEIKSNNHREPHSTKIIMSDEVVYFSERHGDIERWEDEWLKQKNKMALSENAHECPHGTTDCFEYDLCMSCQIDQAKSGLL